MKKLFGGIDLTWKKLIIFAVIAGLYTGFMAYLPAAKDTSFADISITFEWWVLFGIIIIVNSKSPLDSALKCFIFFLISQPLVYLVQVPFNAYGWGIFRYYPAWFRWTLLTFPMGYIGWYMKKDQWWSLLILVPMLLFVGFHYTGFLRYCYSFFPYRLLSTLFCAVTMLIYPWYIFRNEKIRKTGVIISAALIALLTVYTFTAGKKTFYTTTVMVNNGSMGVEFDDSYSVSLSDESFGKVYIVYEDNIEDYMINADFDKGGSVQMTLTSPEGDERVFSIYVHSDHLDITEITGN